MTVFVSLTAVTVVWGQAVVKGEEETFSSETARAFHLGSGDSADDTALFVVRSAVLVAHKGHYS